MSLLFGKAYENERARFGGVRGCFSESFCGPDLGDFLGAEMESTFKVGSHIFIWDRYSGNLGIMMGKHTTKLVDGQP